MMVRRTMAFPNNQNQSYWIPISAFFRKDFRIFS